MDCSPFVFASCLVFAILAYQAPWSPGTVRQHEDDTLSMDLLRLYQETGANDPLAVPIVHCNGEILWGHKSIVGARSSTFMDIFKEDSISVTEMDCFLVRDMLRYIYGGKVKHINNFHAKSKDLLPAAVKYNLKGLKDNCEQSLINSLTDQNALEFFRVAEINDAPRLRQAAKAYIHTNKQNVIVEGWKRDMAGFDELVAELYEYEE